MTVTRTLAGLAAAVAVVGGLAMATAAPASALVSGIDCTTAATTSLILAPGESVFIPLGEACESFELPDAARGSATWSGSFLPFVFTGGTSVGFAAGGLGGTFLDYTAPETSVCASTEIIVYGGTHLSGTALRYVVTVGDCPASSAVPSWVQGYGRNAAADVCLDGWNPSWEQWPNSGTGGYVCTRSIPSLG